MCIRDSSCLARNVRAGKHRSPPFIDIASGFARTTRKLPPPTVRAASLGGTIRDDSSDVSKSDRQQAPQQPLETALSWYFRDDVSKSDRQQAQQQPPETALSWYLRDDVSKSDRQQAPHNRLKQRFRGVRKQQKTMRNVVHPFLPGHGIVQLDGGVSREVSELSKVRGLADLNSSEKNQPRPDN